MLAGVLAFTQLGGSNYHVKVLLSSASNLVVGGTVDINGFKSGNVSSLSVDGGKALVGLSLSHSGTPLHDGAKVVVEWKALLGERIVDITDGPKGNPTIPEGAMIPGSQIEPVELDQVLDALDPKTRTQLVSLVKSLNTTMSSTNDITNLQATLKSAGPAVSALGNVLQALGADGPAIKSLVTEVSSLVTTASSHDTAIAAIVDQLTHLSSTLNAQRTNVGTTLQQLPGTLKTASKALSDVPSAVRAANPLLKALQPATAQLPTVAKNLAPVLTELKPVSAQLKPTLAFLSQVLQYSPGLLDSVNATAPGIQSTLSYLEPALNFLRPYTPEAIGFLSNWGSAFGSYDSNGHYARILGQAGVASLDDNPGIQPLGTKNQPYPEPGALVNQPWTDAFGSGTR